MPCDGKRGKTVSEPCDWRVLSLCAPWSLWVRLKLKGLETRTWATKYRGQVLIHESQRLDEVAMLANQRREQPRPTTPRYRGMVIAIADLVDCRMMMPGDVEAACCDWEPGRYVFQLENVRPVVPVPIKGALGIFKWRGSIRIQEDKE